MMHTAWLLVCMLQHYQAHASAVLASEQGVCPLASLFGIIVVAELCRWAGKGIHFAGQALPIGLYVL